MGKGAAKQSVDDFYMSIFEGLCHGPVDAVTGLLVGEKEAWYGEITAEGGVFINAPNLFGGPRSEGGVSGTMYYLPGGPNQVMPDSLAARMGLTSDTSPAYRGIASVFFVGTDGYEAGSLDVGGSSGDGSTYVPPSTGGGSTGGGGGYQSGGGYIPRTPDEEIP